MCSLCVGRERGRLTRGGVTHPTMDAQRSDTFKAFDVTTLRRETKKDGGGERESQSQSQSQSQIQFQPLSQKLRPLISILFFLHARPQWRKIFSQALTGRAAHTRTCCPRAWARGLRWPASCLHSKNSRAGGGRSVHERGGRVCVCGWV